MKFMLKKRISNDDNITLKYLYKFVFHCVLQYFELYCHMLASNEKLDFKLFLYNENMCNNNTL